MFKSLTAIVALTLSINAFAADEYVTPADMSKQAQKKMYSMLTDYNQCMVKGILKTDKQSGDVRKKADKILRTCEPKLQLLKTHLSKNKVTPGLIDGFITRIRSRGARMILSHAMANMAMQAAAADNAKKTDKK